MIFSKSPLKGAYIIDLEKREDERGFFARAFCAEEFSREGLVTSIVQINNSLASTKGTLRGMHYQLAPKAETKIVRCIRGALYDVIVDLRADSPNFCEWFGTILSSENRRMLYVPKGCAHGFLTLEDNTEALYLVDEFYAPERERGIRWNDPKFEIHWPFQDIGLDEPAVLSEKDRAHLGFDPAIHLR